MTNPVNPGSNPPHATPVSNTPSDPLEAPTPGAPKPENWGPGWAQFQDFLKSPENMAMFQKTLLNNMSQTMQQNQARYEANKQLIKELYGDDNQ